MATIYLIGSLRNPEVPKVAQALRAAGHEVFDDWFSAGPEADDWWQRYETERGHSYLEALDGYPTWHTFNYDLYHLNRMDVGVLVTPAGKSAHLEFGYMIGRGKRGYVLLDKIPDRWDAMLRFANGVYDDLESLLDALRT